MPDPGQRAKLDKQRERRKNLNGGGNSDNLGDAQASIPRYDQTHPYEKPNAPHHGKGHGRSRR